MNSAGALRKWSPALPEGLVHKRAWLAPETAAALLTRCLTGLDFTSHPVRVFGRLHRTPRATAFIAPVGISYRYSGYQHQGQGVPVWLESLRARLEQEVGKRFTSILATHYRNGADRVGWHADNEPELGPNPVLAVLSLGASRDLCFRSRDRSQRKRWCVPLASGDLLVMAAGVQQRLEHAVPRRAAAGVRVSLSFRPHER